jgi:hypothetical protein
MTSAYDPKRTLPQRAMSPCKFLGHSPKINPATLDQQPPNPEREIF